MCALEGGRGERARICQRGTTHRALVAEALLAGAERAEVLCLGKFGVVEMGLVRL